MSNAQQMSAGLDLDRAIAERLGYRVSLATEGYYEWSETTNKDASHGVAIFSPDGRYVYGSCVWWSDPNYPSYSDMSEACWKAAYSGQQDDLSVDVTNFPVFSADVNATLTAYRSLPAGAELEFRMFGDVCIARIRITVSSRMSEVEPEFEEADNPALAISRALLTFLESRGVGNKP